MNSAFATCATASFLVLSMAFASAAGAKEFHETKTATAKAKAESTVPLASDRGSCYYVGKTRKGVQVIFRVGVTKGVCKRFTDLDRGTPAWAIGKKAQATMAEIYKTGRG